MGGGAYNINNRINAAIAAKKVAAAKAAEAQQSQGLFNLETLGAVPPIATAPAPAPSNNLYDPSLFSNTTSSSFDIPASSFAPAAVAEQPITQEQAAANSQALADKQKAEGIWEAGQKGTYSAKPAEYYSEMSTADQNAVDASRNVRIAATEERRAADREANPDFSISSFYETTKATAEGNITKADERAVFNNHDPNRGELAGSTAGGYLRDQQVVEPWIEAIRTHKVPFSEKLATPIELDYKYDYDADNLYMKQPPSEGNMSVTQGFTDAERKQYQDLEDRGSFVDISGGDSKVGEYTMAWIEDPPEASTFDKILNSPVMSIAAAAAGPLGVLAHNGAKVANGQTLKTGDYASIALAGLQQFDIIKAPLNAEDARKAGELARGTNTGMIGDLGDLTQEISAAGYGIGGLSYGQSVGLVNAAATGDPKAFIYGELGKYAVDKAFTAIEGVLEGVEGFDPNLPTKIAGVFQTDDLQAGLLKVVDRVAGGADFDDALAYGLGTYIREGGSFGLSLSIPDGFGGFTMPDLGVLEDVVRAAGRSLEKIVRTAGSFVDDKVLQPIIKAAEPLEEAGKKLERTVKEVGRATDDNLIQPIREVAKDIDDKVFQPLAGKASELDTAVRDVLSDADTAVRQELTKLDEGLYDLQSPFSTPQGETPHFNSFDGPDINLPSFNLDFGFNSGSGMLSGVTTGKIFGDELFEFKNKIELTEYGPMFQEQEVDIEELLTSPFDSTFEKSERFL